MQESYRTNLRPATQICSKFATLQIKHVDNIYVVQIREEVSLLFDFFITKSTARKWSLVFQNRTSEKRNGGKTPHTHNFHSRR